ncbi:MAG: hypothetical protein ABWY06_23545 [Pseudomonas sp.]|uniref:hypothetical protein n=1 Tax=Pseudomonas sp. TaxID=306 RepID=UPI00339482D9
MSSPQITEADMRAALGLAPSKATPAKTINKRRSTYTLVELSVRHPSGGPPFRFEYKSSSISTLQAQLEAEKAVRKEGLETWALLDIRQISE